MAVSKTVFQPRRPLYVYLRSAKLIQDDEAAVDAADAMFREVKWGQNTPIDDAELLAPDGDFYTLGDGFVVRIKSQKTCAEAVADWSDHLTKFAAWAIHDGKADAVESAPHLAFTAGQASG